MTPSSLPDGWTWSTLGEATALNPRRWDQTPADDEVVSFVPMAAVEAGTGKLDPSAARPWGEVKKGYTIFQDGDVLFAKITPCMENGKFALASGLLGGRGAGSTEYHVLRPSASVDPKFLLYFVLQESFRRDARAKMKGAAGQLRIPPEFLAQAPLPLPPLPEQHRIVAAIEAQLSRLDAAVASLTRARANLARYRAAVLAAACAGRLVPTEAALTRAEGRPYEPADQLLARILAERAPITGKRRGQKSLFEQQDGAKQAPTEDLPEGWAWTTLASIAVLKGGITKGQRRSAGEPVQSVPYLRVANVQRGYLDLRDMKHIDATETEIADLKLLPGDVLFNEGGDRDKLGRGWVWRGEIAECIHQNHVFRARLCSSDLEPKFLSWYGNTAGQRYFIGEGKQPTNLASINLTKLGALPVPLPPAPEQHRIVTEVERQLSVVEAQEATVDTALKRAERLRQAVLRRAFAGQLLPRSPQLVVSQDGPPWSR